MLTYARAYAHLEYLAGGDVMQEERSLAKSGHKIGIVSVLLLACGKVRGY